MRGYLDNKTRKDIKSRPGEIYRTADISTTVAFIAGRLALGPLVALVLKAATAHHIAARTLVAAILFMRTLPPRELTPGVVISRGTCGKCQCRFRCFLARDCSSHSVLALAASFARVYREGKRTKYISHMFANQ